MPELMNAVVLTGFGGLEKMIYMQVPKPIPQAGEVLIKVGASAVNNTDINTRTGWYRAEENINDVLQDKKENAPATSAGWQQKTDYFAFPRIQGADIVGQVVDIGADVDAALRNQRVVVDGWIRDENFAEYGYIGSEMDGGFAEYVAVPTSMVYPIDSALSDTEIATFLCAYSTAENMLLRGSVSNADTAVILGASGGVGTGLIQLCKIRGTTVIAIVSCGKEDFAFDVGADYVYARDEHLAENLANHQVTVCLDVVGGDYLDLMLKTLVLGGRYVSCGAIGGPRTSIDLRDLVYKDLQMIGVTRVATDEGFRNLVKYIEDGLLKPLVAKVFPLSQLREAQQFFQTKVFFGKVVITVNEQN